MGARIRPIGSTRPTQPCLTGLKWMASTCLLKIRFVSHQVFPGKCLDSPLLGFAGAHRQPTPLRGCINLAFVASVARDRIVHVSSPPVGLMLRNRAVRHFIPQYQKDNPIGGIAFAHESPSSGNCQLYGFADLKIGSGPASDCCGNACRASVGIFSGRIVHRSASYIRSCFPVSGPRARSALCRAEFYRDAPGYGCSGDLLCRIRTNRQGAEVAAPCDHRIHCILSCRLGLVFCLFQPGGPDPPGAAFSLGCREIGRPSRYRYFASRLAILGHSVEVTATAMVLLITGSAEYLGSKWSGILAPFPAFTCIMAVFAHKQNGAAAAHGFMRGIIIGCLGAVAFYVVVGFAIEHTGIAVSYLLATVASAAVNGLCLAVLMLRPGLRSDQT